ncbi:ATP-dependent 6-phosphofructokinase [Geobacter sp. DSM 9736]|uniref:ATP-dependent 6-phosphofructokinase n=1 Tax=Geobacter sp. DSM 9736 TaxID=1277350 RepID=UPI000B4FF53A|nr:ATP-dependent 6-phosphofructokinase [Geobacter sp. DSM 9736]SNB46248.1 6-phosphofructokinase 1 [Geobacter sp. DSM 9736]
MKRIAVLTSGGDAPGMNAAIRAVVRVGLDRGMEVMGIRNGYKGLLEGDCYSMGARDVGGIIQMAGTILGSARCREFETEEGQLKGLEQLRQKGIEGLVVIGGNGSQTGACALSRRGFPVVGVASTIDNDLYGSDITIGVNTALDVALEAIDRLKVTASSHHRAFLVEVMGRKCGYLALTAGIAGGAEVIVLPEKEMDPEAVAAELRAAYDKGKKHAIVVVAEGANYDAEKISEHFRANRARLGFEVRATKLGHTQRGGNPTAFDRLLGTRLGAAAAYHLKGGEHGVLVGLIKGEIATTPLEEVAGKKKPVDLRMLELAQVLAK